MSFVSYITYNEYLDLGGMVSEDEFNILERKAQRMVDRITFDRVKQLAVVPDEVKDVLTEFVNRLSQKSSTTLKSTANAGGNVDDIVQYSNGVETITWRKPTFEQETKELTQYAITYLPDWLVYRGVFRCPKQFLATIPEEYLDPGD